MSDLSCYQHDCAVSDGSLTVPASVLYEILHDFVHDQHRLAPISSVAGYITFKTQFDALTDPLVSHGLLELQVCDAYFADALNLRPSDRIEIFADFASNHSDVQPYPLKLVDDAVYHYFKQLLTEQDQHQPLDHTCINIPAVFAACPLPSGSLFDVPALPDPHTALPDPDSHDGIDLEVADYIHSVYTAYNSSQPSAGEDQYPDQHLWPPFDVPTTTLHDMSATTHIYPVDIDFHVPYLLADPPHRPPYHDVMPTARLDLQHRAGMSPTTVSIRSYPEPLHTTEPAKSSHSRTIASSIAAPPPDSITTPGSSLQVPALGIAAITLPTRKLPESTIQPAEVNPYMGLSLKTSTEDTYAITDLPVTKVSPSEPIATTVAVEPLFAHSAYQSFPMPHADGPATLSCFTPSPPPNSEVANVFPLSATKSIEPAATSIKAVAPSRVQVSVQIVESPAIVAEQSVTDQDHARKSEAVPCVMVVHKERRPAPLRSFTSHSALPVILYTPPSSRPPVNIVYASTLRSPRRSPHCPAPRTHRCFLRFRLRHNAPRARVAFAPRVCAPGSDPPLLSSVTS